MPVVYRSLRAGDGCAFEVGVAFDVHRKTTIACFEAALLGDALVIAVDVGFGGAHVHDGRLAVTKRRYAQAHPNACAGLLVFVGGAGGDTGRAPPLATPCTRTPTTATTAGMFTYRHQTASSFVKNQTIGLGVHELRFDAID